jgi:hypothetical protein
MPSCFARYRPGATGGGTAAASRSAQSTADRVKLRALTIDLAAAHEGSTYTTTVTRHGVVKPAHPCGAARWCNGRIGNSQRFAGEAEAGANHTWAGSDRLGSIRSA